MKINKVLAFDIGGTKIAYATVDRNGKILNEVIRHPTPAAPGAAAKLLKTIIAQFEDQIDAVAVSTAGTVDRTNSRITGSVGNMPEGYMDTDFKALSASRWWWKTMLIRPYGRSMFSATPRGMTT